VGILVGALPRTASGPSNGLFHDPKPRPIAKCGIAVLTLTAYAKKDDEERARAAECNCYIAEPIDTRALPGVVAGYIAKQCGGTA
jgi:CheY-like chemotaxis protein